MREAVVEGSEVEEVGWKVGVRGEVSVGMDDMVALQRWGREGEASEGRENQVSKEYKKNFT